MFRVLDVFGKCSLGCALALMMCGLLDRASAQKSPYTVLYTFTDGSDGAKPTAGLILDKADNLYGTTADGGGTGCENQGCGTVFKLAPDGTETVLHAFTGTNGDGATPYFAGLIADKEGNLYGTTAYGGITTCSFGFGCGTVFKLAPDGTETVLYSFTGTNGDGDYPVAGLIADKEGNLYGTTGAGGDLSCGSNGSGCGTVFKLAADGTETVLHAFTDTNGDGYYPVAGLIADKEGDLYGTTYWGGRPGCADNEGCGTVFKVAPDGTETVLYSFTGGTDGGIPLTGLIMDKAGNLYGTTVLGGKLKCGRGYGCGTVFKVTPQGAETVLYAFQGRTQGSVPAGTLLADKAGNLYGTTADGGGGKECNCSTLFKLAPDGTETVLYNMRHRRDGRGIEAGLIADETGNLYGTASYGGPGPNCLDNGYGGCGVVFELKNGESKDR